MTRDEILTLRAGPDTDRLVAERVLGLKPCDRWKVWGVGLAGTEYMHESHGEPCYNVADPPWYSRHIAAAWAVVEKLKATWFETVLAASSTDGWQFGAPPPCDSYSCMEFGRNAVEAPAYESAAMAICVAALLATLENE